MALHPQVNKLYPSLDLKPVLSNSVSQIKAGKVWDLHGKDSNLGNNPFDFRAGYSLPAFKAKLIKQSNFYALSYDAVNSTAFFSDDLLTHYNGEFEQTYPLNGNSYRRLNRLVKAEGAMIRPADILLEWNTTSTTLSYDQYTLDKTPVMLTATLNYDLNADDFSPPVITQLSIETLGKPHNHLAKGNGLIKVSLSDESPLAQHQIQIRPTGSTIWSSLVDSNSLVAQASLQNLTPGQYDLQITAIDQSGNSITYTATPAFISELGCRYDNDCDSHWDAHDSDDDNDGIPDDVERLYGLNPFDGNDASQDLDGDGLSNLLEHLYGSDMNDPTDAQQDSDNDGFGNLDEVRLGSDPLNRQSTPSVLNGWLELLLH